MLLNFNQVLRNFGFTSLALAAFTSCAVKSKPVEEKKPNVIFILADDLGYGDLGFLGQKNFTTPHIDAMASQGLVFNNAYTGSSVCAPSRASLLTGKHTGRCSVRGNAPAQLLSDDEATIAKVLKSAGYTTGCIGKWGIGHPPPVDDPARKGFDYFYGFVNMWHAHNFFPEFLYRNSEKVYLKNKLRLNPDGSNPWAKMPEGTGVAEVREEYVHDLFDAEALQFIETNKEKPFFLYLAYNSPHANNEDTINGSEVTSYAEFANKDWPDVEKGFAAMMRNVDNSVGKVLEKLKSLGLDDNTIVVFCSDNGPHQEGGHKMEFFNSNGELRGKKRDFYNGGIRTPFIVRWPSVIKEPRTTNHLSAFWDVMPTLCDIAGVAVPDSTDGISFLPVLKNETQDIKHDYLYYEFYEQGGKQAIVYGKWKGVKYNVKTKSKPVYYELFDMEADPSEVTNVAAQHPEVIAKIDSMMTLGHKDFVHVSLFEEDGISMDFPF